MSDKEYFAVDAMSASMIKAGAVSMLYMQHRMKTPMTPSPAMIKGTLGHMAVLEPERFSNLRTYDGTRSGKEYKELVAEWGEDAVISTNANRANLAAVSVLMDHPEVQRLGLFKEGRPEVEIYWDEDGKPCKCKVDWLGPDYWIEYKTTANLASFQYTSEKMFYNLQLGWYDRGVSTLGKPRKRYVVVQEQKAPYDVKVMKVSEVNCKRWWRDCVKIHDRWIDGDRSGAYNEIEEFELSMWAEDDTVDMQGIDDQLDAMFPMGEKA